MDYLFTRTSEHKHIKAIFDEHYGRLVHFSYQFVADRAAAEDIVQDAFIRYWDQCRSVSSSQASIKSFLYTSVKNASLNALRHSKVVSDHISTQDAHPVEDCVINAMIRSEVLAEIYAALGSLPVCCQQISRLSYLEGKTNNEIAEQLGISVNTVKTQKQRAIRMMRLRLSPELFALLVLLLQY